MAEGSRSGSRGLPLLLIVLALVDLRVELLLLMDHFTITSLWMGYASRPCCDGFAVSAFSLAALPLIGMTSEFLP